MRLLQRLIILLIPATVLAGCTMLAESRLSVSGVSPGVVETATTVRVGDTREDLYVLGISGETDGVWEIPGAFIPKVILGKSFVGDYKEVLSEPTVACILQKGACTAFVIERTETNQINQAGLYHQILGTYSEYVGPKRHDLAVIVILDDTVVDIFRPEPRITPTRDEKEDLLAPVKRLFPFYFLF